MAAVIKIKDDYITLGQLLKLADWIQSGGEAKMFLSEYSVLVNGERDERRGRKVYPGDVVAWNQQSLQVVKRS